MELLYEYLSEDVANLIEIGLITKYKHDGIKLCNMTIGGEGNSGHKHSNESKKVMSEKKIGRKLTEEHKQKIGQAHKGKIISDKQKKQISETLKGKKLSDAHKIAISNGVKKIKT